MNEPALRFVDYVYQQLFSIDSLAIIFKIAHPFVKSYLIGVPSAA
jgi:hypothetical protein